MYEKKMKQPNYLLYSLNMRPLSAYVFRKKAFCIFVLSNKNRIMATQYQKTSSQIIDLLQQILIKKHCFLEI
jgi:hypothetical protein